MKAHETYQGQKFSTIYGYRDPRPRDIGRVRHGVILSNHSRQGDEVVIVEWDDNLQPQAMNVNDLELK